VYTLTQVLPPRKGLNLFLRAKFVLNTLEAYFSSADEDITTAHVPNEQLDEKTGLRIPVDHSMKMVMALSLFKRSHEIGSGNFYLQTFILMSSLLNCLYLFVFLSMLY